MTTWTTAPMCAFDLETTGPNPLDARIVTACIATIEGPTFTAQNWLLDPEVEIPAGATAVHGITTEHAHEHGMYYDDGLNEIAVALEGAWAAGHTVVAFNASYDLTVMHHEYRRVFGETFTTTGLVVDPFVIDRAIDPYRKGKRTLGVTCDYYGVKLGNAHEAEADAIAAARLAWKLGRQPLLAGKSADDLMAWQAHEHAERQLSFANYLRRSGKPAGDVDGSWPIRGAA
ncbi:exonuclease domain-containing protein [Rhodococcus maanshanensis]|uniref:exonuclease domain-containing protein n=1 Tax=Rhodococcus maanshanensis TaxID=183556 RepID=UPI0022B38371|nr:exonuclease domain-containing protein [Rhodococcus maanshanensis]MCZ4557941.1 exonuclease domain-containing protein [Rhodococcus maanshanensis]